MADKPDICNHTVKLGGKYYAPDDPIVVKDTAERERLLSRGAIRAADEPPPPAAVVEVKVGEVEEDKPAEKKGRGK